MEKFTDDQLLKAVKRVITCFIRPENWHAGESINTLRERLKSIDPKIILDSANEQAEKDALIELPDSKWNELVDRVDLEEVARGFPNLKS